MKIIAFSALAFVPLFAEAASSWNCKPGSFGTGPGSLKIEERTVGSEFKGIAVRNGACVEFVQGSAVNIKVEAAPEVLEQLEIAVERNALVIGEKRSGNWNWGSWGNRPVRVLVTAPNIESMAVAGSGDIISTKLTADRIKLSVAGSGDLALQNLTANSVNASVAGSGDIRLAGKVQSIKVSVAGSGDIDTTRLEASDASISVAGSGDAKVWVTSALAVSVAGSGTVSYYGNPQLSSRTAGSGTVKKVGDRP